MHLDRTRQLTLGMQDTEVQAGRTFDIITKRKRRQGTKVIWNETKECISRDELAELQSKRLVKVVNRVYHNVEYYRKKMQEVGIEPGDIRGIEDITKLPYTTKNDLRDTYPFGLFAAPQSDIVRVHASSGTTSPSCSKVSAI